MDLISDAHSDSGCIHPNGPTWPWVISVQPLSPKTGSAMLIIGVCCHWILAEGFYVCFLLTTSCNHIDSVEDVVTVHCSEKSAFSKFLLFKVWLSA